MICFIVNSCQNNGDSDTPTSKTILEQSDDGSYRFSFSSIEMEVLPELGGRISGLSYDGNQVLTSRDLGDLAFGSTLWPSPQSRWNWPPPAQLDSGPYSAETRGDTLLLESETDSLLSIQFMKKFFVSTSDTSIFMVYSIKHHVDTFTSVAPWENTRVPKGGLVFFPVGETSPRGKGLGEPVPGTETDGIYWYHNQVDTNRTHLLSIADCGPAGWLAFARKGLLFLKVFDDIPPAIQAPGEGEIAIYVSPEKAFMEIEVEGPYTALDGNEILEWQMQWVVRPLPEGVNIELGNQVLVDFASALARQRKD